MFRLAPLSSNARGWWYGLAVIQTGMKRRLSGMALINVTATVYPSGFRHSMSMDGELVPCLSPWGKPPLC